LPEYDPKVTTHIVTDALMRPTLRALGLKALKDIPDHIPTVKWSWVLTGIGRNTLTKEEIDAKLRDVWMHAAFSERMDAGYTPYIPTSLPSFKIKGKEKAHNEVVHCSRNRPSLLRWFVFLYNISFSSHPFIADINDRRPRKAIFDLIKPIGICLGSINMVEYTYRLYSFIH